MIVVKRPSKKISSVMGKVYPELSLLAIEEEFCMDVFSLDEMIRGWFVGGFEPTIYKTTDVEVALQKFKTGDYEESHCHKIATEITVIVSGKAEMKGEVYGEGSIIRINPGEYTDFKALEDTVTAVVKLPGVLNDKYLEKES